MTCDLHVHTTASGMCSQPVFRKFCRECYNEPQALYETLKRRGMSFVTVTDHDSIDAAEELRKYPDFFLSEEVTCTLPSGNELHVGVYGITEQDHTAFETLRHDLHGFIAYLNEKRLFFSANHVFSALTGRRTRADYDLVEELFPGMETLNGMIPRRSNRAAARLARRWNKVPVAGSDSHVLFTLASAFTEVPGAATIQEFLAGLRAGYGIARGESGSCAKLTMAISSIGFSMIGERRATAVLLPLLLALPVYSLANYVVESAFLERWSRELLRPDVQSPEALEAVA